MGLVLTAATTAPSFAQDDPCGPIYEKFTTIYRGKTIEEKKSAIATGEEMIAKCSTVEEYKDPIAFVNKQLPKLKADLEYMLAVQTFEAAAKAPKDADMDAAFAAGKTLLARDPELIDVTIAMAILAHDKNIDKYNGEAINYARQAIQKIEGGAQPKGWGVWSLNLEKKEGAAASKDNTLSWMNFFIGNIMYSRQNQKKEALPYLYKSTQYNVGTKTVPVAYELIGDYYKDEYNRIDDERTKTAEEAKALPADDPQKKELVDKVNELLALQKGYADRMIDAYARAYNNAGNDKAYKDGLYNTMKVLHNVRFDGKGPALDSYIAEVTKKPMPDPTVAVTPVTDAASTSASTTPAK